MSRREFLEAPDHLISELLAARDQAFVFDHPHYSVGRGTGEQVSSVGPAVVSETDGVGHLLAAQKGCDRDAAAEALSQGQNVGDDAVVFEGEPATGPTDPGLNLVEDEERATAIAGLADPGEIAGRRRSSPRLAWTPT